MPFSNEMLVQMITLVLAVCGFLVARKIHKHKKPDEKPLVCMAGFDCHAVVHSDYSKFFGVPVEIFGMIYYAFMSIAYLVIIFAGTLFPMFFNVIQLVSLVAFVFSLYLIFIQIFILKKGCSWCLVSSVICFLIFISTMFNYDVTFLTHIT